MQYWYLAERKWVLHSCSCAANLKHGAEEIPGHCHAQKRHYESETVLIEKKSFNALIILGVLQASKGSRP